MPLETIALGPPTVIALQDAEGAFVTPRAEAFPHATAEQWAAADAADPAARSSSGEWWLRFRSYAIRYEDSPVTLVDAGIGPAGLTEGQVNPSSPGSTRPMSVVL